MAVYDIYSKRKKRENGEELDIYIYDEVPLKLRNQIMHIINNVVGISKKSDYRKSTQYYEKVVDILCGEYGVEYLIDQFSAPSIQLDQFIKKKAPVDHVLDAVEICFKLALEFFNNPIVHQMNSTSTLTPKNALSDLNIRFKENHFGFSFEGNQIIRIDSTYMHSEVVKPTLNLLSHPKFQGANEEYLSAHEHYRHGRNKECLVDCLKAFESTMKVICQEKGWAFNTTDTASKLINVLFTNNLVPTFTQNQFTSLRNLLESGIPTIRNKTSGHGQGGTPQDVEDTITRYGLNLTGTNIIFLIEQSEIV